LSKQLLDNIEQNQHAELAKIESSDQFAISCVRLSDRNLTLAEVETAAVILDVFDDLWPMYRFQNVNLKI